MYNMRELSNRGGIGASLIGPHHVPMFNYSADGSIKPICTIAV